MVNKAKEENKGENDSKTRLWKGIEGKMMVKHGYGME